MSQRICLTKRDKSMDVCSRKVIDRAFTIDFAEFFLRKTKLASQKRWAFRCCPVQTKKRWRMCLPMRAAQRALLLWGVINAVLRGSSFELAYRALNEFLLALVCFKAERRCRVAGGVG